MKNLDTEQDALKKITDYLLEETLEPAKSEAQKIIEDAKKKAAEIVSKADADQKKLIEETKEKLENEQKSFKSALALGLEQSVEALKQKVIKDLFSPALQEMVDREMVKPQVIANLIDALVKAIQKDGLAVDLKAFIPANASAQEINTLLTKEVLSKLENQSVALGKMHSGVEVKVVDKKVTLEMTGKDVQEMLLNFIRRDLRNLIFQSEN